MADLGGTTRAIRTGAGSVWHVPARRLDVEERLQKELEVPSLVAASLVARGIEDPCDAHEFLNPSLNALYPPELLPDYEAAKDAILGARARGERIYVHGDYDVDGMTSAALFKRFLSAIDCDVHVHVPHRERQGYGVSDDAVEEARAMGAKLFLTCDCGISAFEQVEKARSHGMTVVVTDHHTCGDQLPNAHAVVNPHRHDSRYPFKSLSGAGVVFKLCYGITRDLDQHLQSYCNNFLDLATLGTVADIMPLIDENRIITRHGLLALTRTKKVGLQALYRVAELFKNGPGDISARQIGFTLGPRLNAAGRLDDAAMSLKLLLTKDPVEAQEIAEQLEQLNVDRRAQQAQMQEEAVAMIESNGLAERYVIVVGKEGWHPGIVGLVAGRILETYRRPAFVVSIDGGKGKGSARSNGKFNLAETIRELSDVFEGGGGHAQAAGFSVDPNRLDELALRLQKYAEERLSPEDFVVTHKPDACVSVPDFTMAALEQLQSLAPFGQGNEEPTFVSEGLTVRSIIPTKKPEHVRVTLESDGHYLDTIAFGLGSRFENVRLGEQVSVLIHPSIETFNGTRKPKLVLKDFAVIP